MLTLYLSLIESEADRIKFEEVYYTYRKQMVLLALSLLHSEDDAEDVVHDVFVRIATKHMSVIQQIQCPEDVRNYILKATKHTALNALRKKEHSYISLDTIKEIDADDCTEMSDESFLDMLYQKMEYEQIVNALLTMAEPYREVLYYHFVVELSVADIAKQLERKIPTIKKQLVRGKKLLLALLKAKGGEPHHVTK